MHGTASRHPGCSCSFFFVSQLALKTVFRRESPSLSAPEPLGRGNSFDIAWASQFAGIALARGSDAEGAGRNTPQDCEAPAFKQARVMHRCWWCVARCPACATALSDGHVPSDLPPAMSRRADTSVHALPCQFPPTAGWAREALATEFVWSVAPCQDLVACPWLPVVAAGCRLGEAPASNLHPLAVANDTLHEPRPRRPDLCWSVPESAPAVKWSRPGYAGWFRNLACMSARTLVRMLSPCMIRVRSEWSRQPIAPLPAACCSRSLAGVRFRSRPPQPPTAARVTKPAGSDLVQRPTQTHIDCLAS